jgi:hypothetical protein
LSPSSSGSLRATCARAEVARARMRIVAFMLDGCVEIVGVDLNECIIIEALEWRWLGGDVMWEISFLSRRICRDGRDWSLGMSLFLRINFTYEGSEKPTWKPRLRDAVEKPWE